MLWAIINFMFHSVWGQFLLLEFFKISNTVPLTLAGVGLVPLSSPYFNLSQGTRSKTNLHACEHITVMQGFKYAAWISRIVSEMSLRTRSHVTEYFESATFSFQIQKFPRPDVYVFKSNLPFHSYPTHIPIHSTTQDSSAKIGNRACVVKRVRFASCSASREPGNEVDILIIVFTVKN